MERRFFQIPVTVEKRADGSTGITGYAAVFHRDGDDGTEFALWDDLIEQIAPEAFTRALKESHDVRALFNHDPSHVLGRSKAGTLRLSVDQRGLKYDIDMPDTATGKDVATSIQRGDITGSSFGFIPKAVEWKRDDNRKVDVRIIKDVDLLDVGPVTFPAYESTTTGLRSLDYEFVKRSRDEWRKKLEKDREAVEVRLRLLTLDELSV